ncbi:MAG: YHYH protein [Alphaproteobacteria bacterium]|nr:YHYH protein [Alphaproteobacteria bacterium]
MNVMPGVQPAFSHDAAATPAASYPEVFKSVTTGTRTDEYGRNKQFLCIDELTQYNGGVAPVYTQTTSPWVEDGVNVIVSKIPYVEGNVIWTNHRFREIRGWATRRFVGNDLPNHGTGEFPVQEGTPAYEYYHAAPAGAPYYTADKIPIAANTMDITVPRSPVYHEEPACIDQLVSGVATQTGVYWHANIAPADGFVDPIAALPTDECFGHPYDTQYHYHGWSWKCFPNQGKPKKHSPLFGYALDGFGIYGPRGDGGKLLTNDDLDACHGHFGVISWDGHKRYMYHYHLNSEFPYGPGCLRGRPLKSANRGKKKIFTFPPPPPPPPQ